MLRPLWRHLQKDKVPAPLSIAAANGSKTGPDNKVIIEKKMTPAQIAEAQKLCREYREKYVGLFQKE